MKIPKFNFYKYDLDAPAPDGVLPNGREFGYSTDALHKVGKLLHGQDMDIVMAVLCSLLSCVLQEFNEEWRIKLFGELMAQATGREVHVAEIDTDEHNIH
jgi:hypothetical protein